MLFNSYEFIFFFLPTTILVYYLLGSYFSHQSSLMWLVLASLFFYGWWNPPYIALICSSILFNFYMGRAIIWSKENNGILQRKFILGFGVTANLLTLAYYKYTNFLLNSIGFVTNDFHILTNIILPIGISFFTFQQIAYLVDTYREKTCGHNLLTYSLFVSFFPQLIAGPIVHHQDMLPQFTRSKICRLSLSNIMIGSAIFCIGLFKKVIIADSFGEIATPVFSEATSGNSLDFVTSWKATFAYTFQIYFDFSGYSDMAIGLARLFNIKLPINFNSPYKSKSIIEFWRRWHISLSRFLKDYLYIPLGGNRNGKIRRYQNLLITMLLGGLWHGASWTFVLWGGLHGIYLIINHIWRNLEPVPINKWWSTLCGRTLTFIAVSLTWVLFRAETFESALNIYEGMLHLPSNIQIFLGPIAQVLILLGFHFDGSPLFPFTAIKLMAIYGSWVLILWFAPNTQFLFRQYNPAIDYTSSLSDWPKNRIPAKLVRWRPNWASAMCMGAILALCILELGSVSEFLYFQF